MQFVELGGSLSSAFAGRRPPVVATLQRPCRGRTLAVCVRLAIVCIVMTSAARATNLPPTPLAKVGYTRISRAAEISADLDVLVAAGPLARKELVGRSVLGRPIETLVLSGNRGAARPLVLLVGTQHGAAEPAGGEAMLSLAREFLQGDLRPLLEDIDVVLLPDANPDGRDSGHRSNAHKVNLNTDFVLLAQPESQALLAALRRYEPQAVLDVHESAILKRQTLARQGYLTNFDAQFEAANNPGITAAARDYGQQHLVPALIAAVHSTGLPAQRYIGEITSTRQFITNGGLSLRNFRNRAGITGAFSVLVETKLDSRDDLWPTYRNIEARVARSLICQRAFVRLVHAERAALRAQWVSARAAALTQPLPLYAAYGEDTEHPRVDITLRRLDNRQLETLSFADHRRVFSADTINMPVRYLVSQPSKALRAALTRQGVQTVQQEQPLRLTVVAERYGPIPTGDRRVEMQSSATRVITAAPGALIIDLAGSGGRLVPMLLDPRSTSSLFRLPQFAPEFTSDRELGAYRVVPDVARQRSNK